MKYFLDHKIKDEIKINIFFKYFNDKNGFCNSFYCSEYKLSEIEFHPSFNTARDLMCVKKSNKFKLQRYDTIDIYPFKS